MKNGIQRRSHLEILVLTLLLSAAACNRSAPAPANQSQSSGATSAAAVKRYPFKGKIVSIDAPTKSASIDGEDIPGFMSAMTMSYEIRPDSDLQKLHPGDSITAEIVVDNSDSNNEKYWLEHVAVASSPQKSQ
jgi:protein SCO1/2